MLARLLLSPPAERDGPRLAACVRGRVVLVTGGSYGIGEEVARKLAGAGARVLLLARSGERLEALQREWQAQGAEVWVYRADLAAPGEPERVARRILSEHPELHAVINNAGRSIRRRADRAAEKRDLERSVAVNLTGPAALLLALLPGLGPGSVLVNVSTVSAKAPAGARWGAYQGSKAGFDFWFASLGAELQVSGIRACAVYLPLTRTRMSAPTYGPWVPALSASEAADAVLRALTAPVWRVAPWWLTGQEALALLVPGAFRWVSGLAERWERRREGRR